MDLISLADVGDSRRTARTDLAKFSRERLQSALVAIDQANPCTMARK